MQSTVVMIDLVIYNVTITKQKKPTRLKRNGVVLGTCRDRLTLQLFWSMFCVLLTVVTLNKYPRMTIVTFMQAVALVDHVYHKDSFLVLISKYKGFKTQQDKCVTNHEVQWITYNSSI